MTSLAYLSALLITLSCLGLLDWRYRLALFDDWRRAAKSLAAAWLGLILWDLLGIWRGIFFSVNSKYTTGMYITTDLPIEELFALLVIVYTPLLAWTYLRSKQNV